MEAWLILLIIFGVLIFVVFIIALILFLVGVSIHNNLVKARNKVKNQFAQIDVQLKRRFDLIPNLVETVKGYTNHEEKILISFAEARTIYQKASETNDINEMAKANNTISKGINAFVNAVKEQYPELHANENFQNLMKELKDTEEKISYQRQFYNDVVLSYNNMVESFPKSIIAKMFNFKTEAFFKTDEASRENPQVKF